MEEAQKSPEIEREEAGATPATSGTPMRLEGGGDKRAKFAALQTVVVNSEEVRSIQKGQGFVNRVVGWLKRKDVLGKYDNADTGWEIIFNSRSVRNVIKHDARDGKIALMEYATDLIEHGIYLETTVKKDGLKSHIFAAKAAVDGKNYTISFVVREDGNGKRYYDHVLMDTANEMPRHGQNRVGVRLTTTDANLPENPDSIYNILKKHLGINMAFPDLSKMSETTG